MLSHTFFDINALLLAKKLLGKVIRVKYGDGFLSVMIVETEAYFLTEKGSHSSLGFTNKREALFMPAGTIYMYYAHGGDSLNISANGAGNAVLIKGGAPYLDNKSSKNMINKMHQLNPLRNQAIRQEHRLCSGQTLLCKSLNLKVPDWNKKTFCDEFYLEDVNYQPRKIIQTTRLGIPTGRDEHLPYRFIDYHYARSATKNPLTLRKESNCMDYSFVSPEDSVA